MESKDGCGLGEIGGAVEREDQLNKAPRRVQDEC